MILYRSANIIPPNRTANVQLPTRGTPVNSYAYQILCAGLLTFSVIFGILVYSSEAIAVAKIKLDSNTLGMQTNSAFAATLKLSVQNIYKRQIKNHTLRADSSSDPIEHWWNQSVYSAPLHPDSARQIATLVEIGGFGLGRLQIDFEIKVVKSQSGDKYRPIAPNRFGYYSADGEPLGTLIPVPSTASIENAAGMHCDIGRNDCHYIVRQDNLLYETWHTSIKGDQLQTQILVIWDLDKAIPESGRGDHCTSADAAGFPIQPLLWNADEISTALERDNSGNGDMGHAIRFILPNDRIANDPGLGGKSGRLYVRPASHAGAPRGPKNSVAYGSRLRLRANFPTDGYNPAALVVINTMKRYGIALADGGNIAMTAESDRYTQTKWRNLGINSRTFDRTPGSQPIKAEDFEVIDTGPRIAETFNCVRNEYPNRVL